jgi:hypothetical protein
LKCFMLGQPRQKLVRTWPIEHRIGASVCCRLRLKRYNYMFLNDFISGMVPALWNLQFYCTCANKH